MGDILEDRVAIITGARGSIGSAIARRFADEGARVVCLEVTEDAAQEAAAKVEADGGTALAVQGDVRDEGSVRAAVDTTTAAFGRLDILVNSAAAGHVPVEAGAVDEMDPAAWNNILAVNLTGAFLMSKYAVKPMLAAGEGAIVHVSSQLGRVGSRGRAAYCSTKGGLIQLAKVMAIDYAERGIRVNALSPGAIAGDRAVRHYGSIEQAEALLAPKHPVQRLGRPPEIAEAALLLVNPRCTFMTGSDLLVDGGYTAW